MYLPEICLRGISIYTSRRSKDFFGPQLAISFILNEIDIKNVDKNLQNNLFRLIGHGTHFNMHAICTVYYINSYNLMLNRNFCTVEVFLFDVFIYILYYLAEELIARRVLLYIMSTCDCI
jgi:hypothetical protein